jgi:O-antigen/teichoic acid export membrane protein
MRAKSFLKHASVYGAGNALLQVAGMVLLPVYTRHLTPSDFGALEAVSRLGAVLPVLLLSNGLRQATFNFDRQAENDSERGRAVGTALALAVGLVAVAAAPVMAAAGPIDAWLGIGDVSLLRLAFLAALAELLTVVPLAATQARLESSVYVRVLSGLFLAKLGLSVLTVVVLGWGAWGVLAASAATSGAFGVGLTLRELARPGVRPDGATFRAMAAFGLPFVPGGLGFFLLHSGDRFFLLQTAGPAALGVYAVGYRLATLVGTFSRDPLQQVWAARMYDVARAPEAAAVFGRAATRILACYLFLAVGLSLFQDEVTRAVAGPSYAAAAGVVSPVLLAYAFQSAADLMDAGFYVRRRTGRKLAVTLASTAVMLALYAALIPSHGAMGAAIATLGGFAFHAAATWSVSRRVLPVSYEWGRLAAMLGLGLSVAAAGRALPVAVWAVPMKGALWASWPLTLWTAGVVSPVEKGVVRSDVRQALAGLRRLIPDRCGGVAVEAPGHGPAR